MNDFFAALYEWLGLVSFYSVDLGDYLRGWDIMCDGETGTHYYILVGWTMVFVTMAVYTIKYHWLLDRSGFSRKHHVWLMAMTVAVLNFLIAFLIPYNAIQVGDYCPDLHMTTLDCIGFGLSNALWSIILFALITSLPFPRRLSTNSSHSTFWKP